jgi:hypothetical protein
LYIEKDEVGSGEAEGGVHIDARREEREDREEGGDVIFLILHT